MYTRNMLLQKPHEAYKTVSSNNKGNKGKRKM